MTTANRSTFVFFIGLMIVLIAAAMIGLHNDRHAASNAKELRVAINEEIKAAAKMSCLAGVTRAMQIMDEMQQNMPALAIKEAADYCQTTFLDIELKQIIGDKDESKSN
jgi:hypothetical protein